MKIYLLDIKDGTDRKLCSEAFPVRFEKSKKFRFEEDRLRSLGAAVLLNKVLGLCENDIKIGEYGKPYSEKIKEKFSISHSGDYCVLAVSGNEVGVDIEKISPAHLNVAKRVFTEEEIAYVNGDSEKFFALWTMKESISKAVGKGMLIHFNGFSVLPVLDGSSVSVENGNFYGKNLTFKGYSLSACTDGTDEEWEVAEIFCSENI